MKSVGIKEYLSVDQDNCFIEQEIEKPKATGHDLLVRVKAVSVNPVDTKIRSPKSHVESEIKIIGWDAAGEVVAVGDECQRFKIGDKVFYAGSITRPGSNAEYQLVDERIVGKKPNLLSFEESAAMPLTTITAWESLFERMDISQVPNKKNANSSLLIIGGAGGVGSIATQIAKNIAMIGTVITTASRSESKEWCEKMGADYSIDHSKPLSPQLNKLGFENIDYILCCSYTDDYFDEMVEVIKPQGSICSIVETRNGASLPISKLQGKSVKFCWELMFTKSLYGTEDLSSQHLLLNEASQLFDEGKLSSTLTENLGVLTADNLTEAHRRIESGSMIGKLVLTGV